MSKCGLPVRDLDTGMVYPSVAAACRHLRLCPSASTFIAITAERPIHGKRLAFVEPDDPDYQPPRRPGRSGRIVRNLDTGDTYVSVAMAADATGIPPTTLYGAIRYGWTARGQRWRYEFVASSA